MNVETMNVETMAENVAEALEGEFEFVDWNDLGEVTIRSGLRTFRMTIVDITDEE